MIEYEEPLRAYSAIIPDVAHLGKHQLYIIALFNVVEG